MQKNGDLKLEGEGLRIRMKFPEKKKGSMRFYDTERKFRE